MKAAIFSDRKRIEKFLPLCRVPEGLILTYLGRECTDEEAVRSAQDAQFIIADAIKAVSANLIAQMPQLKLIHSEGVAFDRIDTQFAAQRGVYVCNNKGANAGAVAEQAILLMLGLLRDVRNGDTQVRAGRQIQTKERMMLEGVTELGDCRVGLIGFGDIAKETAKRLSAFGCPVFYYSRTSLPDDVHAQYHVSYLPLAQLLQTCDIVSLHLPVTPETTNIADEEFLADMKDGALLINTARGELVDQEALVAALISGKIGGAGLDTLSPEPVTTDNPLLHLPEDIRQRLLLSPHIGGTTTGAFRRMHQGMWDNIGRVMRGERPKNIVNGL
ncbi:MAG: 2-hydroxyacid dehydrogenase [Acetanaerobacterium sp.]